MVLDFEAFRHNLRWVVNILSLAVLVLASPDFIQMISPEHIPMILAITVIVNQILSILKRFTNGST